MTDEDPRPYGSRAPSGTYECADCGEQVALRTESVLPPCPNHDDSHLEEGWLAVENEGEEWEDEEMDPQRSPA